MSKIVKAVNVMVSNSNLITDVVKGQHETECFFKYDKKHHWSILRNPEKQFYLSYFPGEPNLKDLAKIRDDEWVMYAPHNVNYSTKELATREAIETFGELFSIVNSKVHGMDDVLDEIIGTDIPF